MATEVKLPELGENIDSGTITRVLVAVGDAVAVEQPIVEIETDKAVLEVPSSAAGTVQTVLVQEGDTMSVGAVILMLTDGSVAPVESKKQKKAASEPKKETASAPKAEKKTTKASPGRAASVPAAKSSPRKTSGSATAAAASPSVRRLAREIGVDITEIGGSGPDNRVTLEDVKSHARSSNAHISGMTRGSGARPAAPDFERWGEVERNEMSKVRRLTAEHMTRCWETVPHVTQFDKADITEFEKTRKQYGQQVEEAGGKLTVTAALLKVLGAALKRFPQFNASIDLDSNQIVSKKFYNVGVAVDTENGLLVPVIRDVDQKTVTEICVDLSGVAERARNRKLTPDEMQGGTFTVTNLGGIGGTAFTPIVNVPEVAILGVSRASTEPVHSHGQFVPRTMLPLTLSYDHRAIDGADGARFLRWVAQALEQPFVLLMED